MKENQYPNESHCFFCEKRKMDFQKGLVCSITQDKREIRRKCPDFEIRLDKRIILRDFNEELEKPVNKKVNIIGNLVKWALIGSVVMGLGFWFHFRALESNRIFNFPIGMMLVGLMTIPFGIGTYIKGMQGLKILKKKKEEYAFILKLYERRP